MQYMLLLYADETAGDALPRAEMAAWMEKMSAYGAALEKAGALVSTGGLGRTRDARTVSTDKDELKVHNGPYADTQEQLGGYFLIEAANMNEAVAWAGKCPAAMWGHIEIREIMYGG
ncbi:MAG: YciI family protein [Devosia sp.]